MPSQSRPKDSKSVHTLGAFMSTTVASSVSDTTVVALLLAPTALLMALEPWLLARLPLLRLLPALLPAPRSRLRCKAEY